MEWKQLNRELGNIDLYWLDFILKGHLPERAKILDAGCGEGRNLMYGLKNEMDVFGIDENPEAIRFLKMIANQYHLDDVDGRFHVMKLEKILFPDRTFDVVVCNAVLHFAISQEHFEKMMSELVRVLKVKGKIFLRTMTDRLIIEGMVQIEKNIYQFPNGELRFVADTKIIANLFDKYDLSLIEPYKEVVVENKHSMGTFIVEKH